MSSRWRAATEPRLLAPQGDLLIEPPDACPRFHMDDHSPAKAKATIENSKSHPQDVKVSIDPNGIPDGAVLSLAVIRAGNFMGNYGFGFG